MTPDVRVSEQDAEAVAQAQEDAQPFVDTPVLAAKRKAFDAPTQENLDALIAAVRVEGAREALTRFLKERREGTASDDQWDMLCDLERFRDREYPAPAAPAGEARPECCRGLGRIRVKHDGVTSVEDCPVCRPAPTPEPEAVNIEAEQDGNGSVYVAVTPVLARRIVALGSRPTQTAEG